MTTFIMYMQKKFNIQKNVLGENLENCSNDPLTGWYRDGCCNTDENDHGLHTVCAKVTTEFLEWCKEAGNDLITPHPEFGFPGLKDGDGWLCSCDFCSPGDILCLSVQFASSQWLPHSLLPWCTIWRDCFSATSIFF